MVRDGQGRLTLIGDLKTGSWPVDADGNPQLYSYVLPFWVAEGCPIRWWCDIRIEQWPKYPLSGLPELKPAVVTGLELRCHLEDLRWALANPNEANPDEETCRFCEGKSNCKAFILSGITYKKRDDG